MRQYHHESYEGYKAAQVRKHDKKRSVIFVSEEELEATAHLVKRHVPNAKFGICHGVRTGYEVFRLSWLLRIEIVGTDIAPSVITGSGKCLTPQAA